MDVWRRFEFILLRVASEKTLVVALGFQLGTRVLNCVRSFLGIKKLLNVPTPREVHKRLRIFEEENVPIKHHLFTSVGTRLQFKDSCIAESVIERMVGMRIPILVIHDSFIVQYRNGKLLRRLMNNVCIEQKLKSIPLIK